MDWIKLAEAAGFDNCCELNTASLRCLPEVRDMCAADKCGVYGRSWACPPACGSLDRCSREIASYSGGILVQTVGALNDEFDLYGIAETQRLHKKSFETLVRQVRLLTTDCLPLSAGTCTRCEVCTYPDKPCRFPTKRLSSMEAYGLLVSEVCNASGLPYYRGEKTISFTSCILINDKEDKS